MLSLFVKFFNESLQLIYYLFNYYLSNIIVLSSFQFLSFLIFFKIYKFLNTFLMTYKTTSMMTQKINFVKDILLIYHTKQIKLITEILNSNLVVEFLNDKPQNINNFNSENLPILPESPISDNDEKDITYN